MLEQLPPTLQWLELLRLELPQRLWQIAQANEQCKGF